jgi:endonuclease-3
VEIQASQKVRGETHSELKGTNVLHQVHQVAEALRTRFGVPPLGNKSNPFNELIYVLLSSKTPGNRYQGAYAALRKRYPRADDLAEALPRGIQTTIRFAGLAKKKAMQIKAIARRLSFEFGRVTLAPVANMDDIAAERFLASLPGVGRKMARCVLMYSLDRPVFPVDNHCHRICTRLGWTKGSPWSRTTTDALQEGIPPKLRKPIHVGMVLLGREYCLPRSPRCCGCPLRRYCPTGQRVVAISKNATHQESPFRARS